MFVAMGATEPPDHSDQPQRADGKDGIGLLR